MHKTQLKKILCFLSKSVTFCGEGLGNDKRKWRVFFLEWVRRGKGVQKKKHKHKNK